MKRREKVLKVRLSEAEMSEVKASIVGTVAALSRGLLLAHVRGGKYCAGPATTERRKLRGEVGKIGNNINQIACVLNTAKLKGEAVDLKRVASVLDEILNEVRSLK